MLLRYATVSLQVRRCNAQSFPLLVFDLHMTLIRYVAALCDCLSSSETVQCLVPPIARECHCPAYTITVKDRLRAHTVTIGHHHQHKQPHFLSGLQQNCDRRPVGSRLNISLPGKPDCSSFDQLSHNTKKIRKAVCWSAYLIS